MNTRPLLPSEVGAIVDRARADALAAMNARHAARCAAGQGPCCCGQHPLRPAEAATELGAEPTGRRRPIGAVHRVLLARRPTYTWAAVTALSVICALKWAFA